MRAATSLVALLLMTGCAAGAGPGEQPSTGIPAIAWNERVLAIAEAEDGFLTLKGVRTAAMVHIAMHDALNGAERRYTTYRLERSDRDANALRAAVHAAYVVAVDQYPDQRDGLTALRRRWISDDHDARDSIALGAAAARAVLDAREADDWDSDAEYQWHPMAPGVYAEFREHSGTPEGFVFGSGWGATRPFALTNPDQFRAPPPPAIDSDRYTRAFDEVKRVGRYEAPSRTDDQTHLALWWKDFAENSHNRLARDLARKEKLDLHAAARLFALLNIGIFDAYVSVFENKFHYNHWRPYTAIRWAAHDGNAATIADDTWNNMHRHTYAFPSYPSAHGTACAAAMTVLADTFGDDYAFTMRTCEVDSAGPFSDKMTMDPPTRTFSSFRDAATECGLSRLYLGIHFRYDSTEGVRLGQRIGAYVRDHELRRIRRDAPERR